MLKEEDLHTPISLAQELLSAQEVGRLFRIYKELLRLGLTNEQIIELLNVVDSDAYNRNALKFIKTIRERGFDPECEVFRDRIFDEIVELMIRMFESQSDEEKIKLLHN